MIMAARSLSARALGVVALLTLGVAACGTLSKSSTTAPDSGQALVSAVGASSRTPTNIARDGARHPAESLSFWGLKPGITFVEVWPAPGYWTEIVAPYLKASGGHYVAVMPSVDRKLAAQFDDKSIYGDIGYGVFNKDSGPLAAAGSADVVLTARNIHDWMWTPGLADKFMSDAFAALKPGGILAVEEHRADPRPTNNDAHDGYVNTADVVAMAEKAGFKLDAKSELNANPKDTKDYPFGVWTLPPSLASAPPGKPPDPSFDHSKYVAIGESDRMTLRFRKPN
jgi:predicted methyltransferase